MEARLTVAIPFYRGVAYLGEAIESVLAQSQASWRLLVCDDGGVEAGAAELVRSFGDERIEYHCSDRHLGMVANWNRCIDLAQGELLTLLHADDRLQPHYAQTMSQLAARHPEAVAYFCGASIIDEAGRRRRSMPDLVKRLIAPRGGDVIALEGERGLRSIMTGDFIMCPTLCFRRDRFGERRFSRRWRQVQDLDLIARLLIDGETILGTRTVAYDYRRHPDNATALQSESRLRFDEEFALFAGVAEEADALGWSRAARVSRRASIVRLHLLYRALREVATLHPGRALGTLRYLWRRRRVSLDRDHSM